VSVKVYVEGGGEGAATRPKCREAFAEYFRRITPEGRYPRVVVCGSRDQAFSRFETAVRNLALGERFVLLVDSEAPVVDRDPVAHLRKRDHWNFPPLGVHRVFLMVQAMEAWFLADREALGEFYGNGFSAQNLPGSPTNIEAIPKDDLERSLKRASKSCRTKGEYHKVRHGFALLALISPAKWKVPPLTQGN